MSNPPYDLAVIGAGSGGLTVAAAAAQFGQRVVLFEKGEMGGDCLNYGCVPSKALLSAAKQAHAMRSGSHLGVAAHEPDVDFAKVQAHVKRAIAAIAPNDSQERFEKLGVKVVRAAARFRDGKSVEAAGEVFEARRIVIATGSRASAPPIPGLADVSYLTNETIFDNPVLPHHLLIIGGGPIGMEMAQAHRRLGSEVTVFEAFDPLAKDDPELTAIVLGKLKAEGVKILSRAAIATIAETGGEISIETKENGTITGSHLLVAAGRQPNIETLNLEAAGIAYTKRGITVDSGLKSSNRRVYAVGDVAGGLQFTHVAGYHAGLVVRNALFALPVRANAVIPWVTYTDPELAHVGLGEAEAREKHGSAIKVLRWPFHENDRAQAEGRTDGLVKVVTGRGGRILGASIVGAQAGELIHPWVQAITQGLKISAMVKPVAPYPTRGEANRRAAITYFSDFPSNPWVRRAISLVNVLRP
jgi:pyruvate/2-oxoglutarate dehydrogenase complex dihydrolipoamide dehydrogenase (E3) component